MRAYRIVKRRHALDAFSGEGARRFGGRWNRPGIPMVYCAESRALAALESLVHYRGEERRLDFLAFEVEIPDGLVRDVPLASLPEGWRAGEPSAVTQDAGSEWQRGLGSIALRVPSVLVPNEHCVLLNPDHPDSSKVMIGYPAAFEFDQRL